MIIRCPRDNVWVTRTRTLSGAGVIHNATRCSIPSGEIRTLPELQGVAHANLNAPTVYVPDSSPILSRHELPCVEAALTSEVNELYQLKDCLAAVQKSLDVDTLVHIQKAILKRETLPYWHQLAKAVSCTITVLLVLYIFFQSKLQRATSSCLRRNTSIEDATPRSPTHPVPASENPTATAYAEPRCDSITFAAYALPCKD